MPKRNQARQPSADVRLVTRSTTSEKPPTAPTRSPRKAMTPTTTRPRQSPTTYHGARSARTSSIGRRLLSVERRERGRAALHEALHALPEVRPGEGLEHEAVRVLERLVEAALEV